MKLFTSTMRMLTAVVLEGDADKVTRELLDQGVLDFIYISSLAEVDPGVVRPHDGAGLRSQLREIRKRIESYYQQGEMTPPRAESLHVEGLKPLRLEDYEEQLSRLGTSFGNYRERQRLINQEILKNQELERYLSRSSASAGGSEFLQVHTGRINQGTPEELEKQLQGMPCFLNSESGSDLVLVSLKRDKRSVDEILARFRWVDAEQAGNRKEDEELLRGVKSRIAALEKEQREARGALKEAVVNQRELLDQIWANIRMHELYATIQDFFSHTNRTTLFSGWIPAEASSALEEGLQRVTGGRIVIEWSEAAEFPREKIPVKVENTARLAPFQMLVDNFATPEYGSIDPTPFVAVAYLAMFGLMFGDAGQGLVISLIGLLGGRVLKKASAGVKKLLQLFVYCGAASVVTGVLFGSYFGYPLFPPLWFDYHGVVAGHGGNGLVNSVYDILKITIYFGIAVISLGLVLNWVNLIRKRRWFLLFLDKTGLLGGWFYGFGVYTAFFFVSTGYKQLPPGAFLSVAFGLPVVLLLFKAPLHHYLHRGEGHGLTVFSFIDFFMEWIVEILEIFSGYLANTLSFMRVAGLGIAHVSLMTAFDSIARMTGAGEIGPAGLLILLVGNVLVIALEGLSAGIQALRLNYYEFFSKYFTGKGISYNPVSLRRGDR